MAGATARPTAMGDGRTLRERVTQVSDAGSKGARATGNGGRAQRGSPTSVQWEKGADG